MSARVLNVIRTGTFPFSRLLDEGCVETRDAVVFWEHGCIKAYFKIVPDLIDVIVRRKGSNVDVFSIYEGRYCDENRGDDN